MWVVVLENKSYAASFAAGTPAPVLHRLAAEGALLEQYHGISHPSLPNYIALVSGQGPNRDTSGNCRRYTAFVATGKPDADGQLPGRGCVLPRTVTSLVDLLEAKGLSWRGYLEDLGFSRDRQVAPCGVPALDSRGRDLSQRARADDQYAARHNPFAYFRAMTDDPDRCRAHLAGMPALQRDLATVATSPAFSLVVPNLCNDGHDTGCRGRDVSGDRTGGLTAVQHWLTRYVPMVLSSPAFRRDGLLLITWDEAAAGDSDACCDQRARNVREVGGGRTGLIALSPFIRPGTVSRVPYNHYALLRTVSDLFGVRRLGYAGQAAGVRTFGPDVFSRR